MRAVTGSGRAGRLASGRHRQPAARIADSEVRKGWVRRFENDSERLGRAARRR